MRLLLTLNTGSSSVKFRVFSLQDDLPLVAGGKVSGIGEAPVFKAKLEGGVSVQNNLAVETGHVEAAEIVLDWISHHVSGDIAVVAHRIVHGGERFKAPAELTPDVLAYLYGLEPLAPLHQPHNLAGVEIIRHRLPECLQYGCFDTAFHAKHEALFAAFALPAEIRGKGVRRYGFHGLSYQWLAHVLESEHPQLAKGRVVAAHLGNGASLCAMVKGRSVDTTMGFTALDGLPMGTRCGAIDPGVVLYLQRGLGYSVEEAERILYEDSGLKGLSGISNDVKTLVEDGGEAARFALAYFVHKTAQHIASMAVSLGGLDTLLFTGGIGENDPNICWAIVEKLAFLPRFEHLVISANEERAMAQSVYKLFKE